MQDAPLVSIILPTYNRASMLREAIDSVLAQTFADWEMFVVDDGSSDETLPYLRSLRDRRIHVIERQHTANPSTLRNVAIARSSGRYVAFLDDDDLWAPQKLEVQLLRLQSQSQARWSYTYVSWIDAEHAAYRMAADTVRQPWEGWIFEYLLEGTAWVALPTVIAERSLLAEAGGFDDRLRFSHDYDLWLRLSRLSQVSIVATPLATVRIHGGNTYRSARLTALESWMSIYDRLMLDPTIDRFRSQCLAARARAATHLAGGYRRERRYLDSGRTLWRVLPMAARLPAWWIALAKTSLYPFMPRALLRAYHGYHASRARARSGLSTQA